MPLSLLQHAYARARSWTAAHKFAAAGIAVVIVGLGWWAWGHAFSASAETRYVLGTAERGTIVASVSGSGQVTASTESTISGASSGKLIAVNVQAGQAVQAGQLLAQVDPTDALYDLQTAQLSYDKLVTVDPDDLQAAKDDVTDAYANARGSLAKASTDMNSVLDGINTLFSGYLSTSNTAVSSSAREYISIAQKSSYAAKELLKGYDAALRGISTVSSQADIEAALAQAYETALSVSQAAKYAQDAVVYVRDHNNNATQAQSDSAYASVTGYVSSSNSVVSSVSSAKASAVKTRQALADLTNGPDTLDLRSEQLSLQQKKDALADTYIRAPFGGIISKVSAMVGDTVGSGTSLMTLISNEQTVTLSLNEVDAAKVKVGDKATITFDAIDGLTLTGRVAELDAAGTVSQGVVSYSLKIAFDAQDERVKAGMTANASIQTDTRAAALVVPSSAVKTQNGQSYVLAFSPELSDAGGASGIATEQAPVQIAVTTGISDDTNIEILSGLTEGQQIITRTISGTATTAARTTATTQRGGFGGGATFRAF
ncbi:MAG TPA: efflux RND transporter periplasmic adaptor subunit [Candidatus Paceibacterota bacterium]|nr:efflux RND transporter periplasmic adaptor subunit [Candidatus Paceibacterota bacterium]